MQIKRVALIWIMFLYCSTSFAVCRAVHWPYAPNMKDLTVANLQLVKRENLYSYLYYELAQKPEGRIPGLAEKLFFFLKNSELNNDRLQMISAIEWAADLKTNQPRVITTREVCSIANRIPNSVTPVTVLKKKKSTKKKIKPTTDQ